MSTGPISSPRRRRLRDRLRRRPRAPVWSVRSFVTVGLVVVGLAATLTFILGERSLLERTEITLAIVAGVLMSFLAVGLYRGVRVKKDEPTPGFSGVSLKDMTDAGPDFSGFDAVDFGGDEPITGCLAAIVAVVVGAIVLVLLVLVLWLLINLGLAVLFVLVLSLSWIFARALRQVFAHGRRCRGNLGRSLATAAFFTLLYTGWLFALTFAADYVLGDRLGG